MRHALLNDKVYKSLRYALIVVGIIILIRVVLVKSF